MRFLVLTLLPTYALACVGGYDTYFDGQCFKYMGGDKFPAAKSACEAQSAHLLILRSKEDQKQFHSVTSGHSVWLDLTCDGEKFVWGDGSAADYTNFKDAQSCSQALVDVRYYLDGSDQFWYPAGTAPYSYYCQSVDLSWKCDNYNLVQLGKSDEMCYSLDKTTVSWSQAESNCKYRGAHIAAIHDQAMNDFVKRTAVNNVLEGGVHLGLQHIKGDYIWSDGTAMDYDYFAPGFPDTQFGECVSMGTGFFPGKWMNMNCTSLLPYICTKPAQSFNDSVTPEGCAENTEFRPGDEIFSPTWGQATGPASCDYALLDEDTTKKVTVEIVFFESNKCCDMLTIYDGLFGTKVLKSFTGYVGVTSVKVTGSSNAVRMEWRASSGAHVRGWHAIVGAV